MSSGSSIISTIGGLAGYIAPQTGPAVAAAVLVASTGHVSEVGQAMNVVIDAVGDDIAQSTILHGAANSVAALGNVAGLSTVTSPLLEPVLHSPLSEIAAATEAPVTLLAPHTGPASAALLSAIGLGDINQTGQATGVVVTAVGNDTTQSTILHGTANTVTAITNGESFHFPTTSGAGALSGVFGETSSHVPSSSAGASAALHTFAAHFDVPMEHPFSTLAHAVHHA